ncbi:MAG: S1 RNA-binding domain-containing protein, partial [Bacteroidales bacterium]|nr:S1 RNA-binding domain-containing protein [Bacteroidales bacterium]
DNYGRVEIAANRKEAIEAAVARIKGIVAVPEVGEIYPAKVRSIMPYGVFCEFLPGKDGLLHISEYAWERIENIESLGLKEGDTLDVKLIDIDQKTGKFKLSRKVLLERPPRPERSDRPLQRRD